MPRAMSNAVRIFATRPLSIRPLRLDVTGVSREESLKGRRKCSLTPAYPTLPGVILLALESATWEFAIDVGAEMRTRNTER